MVRYYLDTSIWLDFFEQKNEPHFPKTVLARALMEKIIRDKAHIIWSEIVHSELISFGYLGQEDDVLVFELRKFLLPVDSTERQRNRAAAIASARDIPIADVLHALLAKEYEAIRVSHDSDFKHLFDMIRVRTPRELI